MSDHSTEKAGGIGFCGLLTILFIGLKLGHVIDWSWWWVLAPSWMPAAVVVAIIIVIGLFCLVAVLIERHAMRQYTRRYLRRNR